MNAVGDRAIDPTGYETAPARGTWKSLLDPVTPNPLQDLLLAFFDFFPRPILAFPEHFAHFRRHI